MSMFVLVKLFFRSEGALTKLIFFTFILTAHQLIKSLISIACLESSTMQPLHVLLLSVVVLSQAEKIDITDDTRSAISDFIEEVMKCREIPGLTVTVTDRDHTLYTSGFGFRHLHSKEKVTTDTVFPIGSITKAFTVTALAAVLAERSDELTWDSPVEEILGLPSPEEPDPLISSNPDLSRQVTLTDILAHRTGLASYWGGFLTGYNKSISEIVRSLRYFQPVALFRSSYVYNNHMYVLAGHVLEELTTNTWQRIVTDKLLEPLGMKNTSFIDEVLSFHDISKMLKNYEESAAGGDNDGDKRDGESQDKMELGDFAYPYVVVDGRYQMLPLVLLKGMEPSGPAGSMTSTANDMARWIRFHLTNLYYTSVPRNHQQATEPAIQQVEENLDKPGEEETNNGFDEFEEGRKKLLIPADVIRETYVAHNLVPTDLHELIVRPWYPVSYERYGYGLGWSQGYYRGYRHIHHLGLLSGYTSIISLYPDLQLGIYMATNGPYNTEASHALHVITAYILDLLLALNPWLDAETACKYPQPFSPPPHLPPLPPSTPAPTFHDYVSKYLSRYLGDFFHPLLGILSVSYHDSEAKLQIHHGLLGRALLRPSDSREIFTLHFLGALSYLSTADGIRGRTNLTVTFSPVPAVNSRRNMFYVNVTVPFMEPQLPPVFTRVPSGGDRPQRSLWVQLVAVFTVLMVTRGQTGRDTC